MLRFHEQLALRVLIGVLASSSFIPRFTSLTGKPIEIVIYSGPFATASATIQDI